MGAIRLGSTGLPGSGWSKIHLVESVTGLPTPATMVDSSRVPSRLGRSGGRARTRPLLERGDIGSHRGGSARTPARRDDGDGGDHADHRCAETGNRDERSRVHETPFAPTGGCLILPPWLPHCVPNSHPWRPISGWVVQLKIIGVQRFWLAFCGTRVGRAVPWSEDRPRHITGGSCTTLKPPS